MTAIEGAGTPERVWSPFLEALALPRLDLASELALDPPPRVVVVAPHPDDEVLGVGGLLALLADAGTPVEVLAVTDGEASNPGGSVPPADLAARRVAETRAALGVLGLTATPHRLGLPDGGAAALELPVRAALAELGVGVGEWLLAPWSGDGHPDHEAVGRACAAAAAPAGARLLAYPVWAWHWSSPDDRSLPWGGALRVDLPAAARERKARAVAEFVSQVAPLGPLPADAPVLPEHVLARFARCFEVLFT